MKRRDGRKKTEPIRGRFAALPSEASLGAFTSLSLGRVETIFPETAVADGGFFMAG